MNYLSFPAFWYAGHQVGLLVFSIWHLLYYINNDSPHHVLAGFFVGFTVHCGLFMSWTLLSWSTSCCVMLFAIPLGFCSWAISLALVISLDHWTMLPFLLMAAIWPFYLLYSMAKFKPKEYYDPNEEAVSLFVQAFELFVMGFGWVKRVFIKIKQTLRTTVIEMKNNAKQQTTKQRKKKKK